MEAVEALRWANCQVMVETWGQVPEYAGEVPGSPIPGLKGLGSRLAYLDLYLGVRRADMEDVEIHKIAVD
jgi:hypothetical protein